MPKKTLIITIKLFLILLIFIVLMSLFVLIIETGLFDEESFAIKFTIAFPLAIICGIFTVTIIFRFESTAPITQAKKIENIELVNCQALETD